MDELNTDRTFPAGLTQALAKLEGLGALLDCADANKWDSLGRPGPGCLSALVRGAHSAIVLELSEHFDTPPA